MYDHRECKRCGVIGNFKEELTPSGMHHGKLSCLECGVFHAWIPKPKNETKRSPNRVLAEDYGVDSCQMCQRNLWRLGNREALESHHVIEIQKGGVDSIENVWFVCTSCHKMIHHQRTYLNDHHKTSITAEKLELLLKQDNVNESARISVMKMLEGYLKNV